MFRYCINIYFTKVEMALKIKKKPVFKLAFFDFILKLILSLPAF